jgi:hypothetical protein
VLAVVVEVVVEVDFDHLSYQLMVVVAEVVDLVDFDHFRFHFRAGLAVVVVVPVLVGLVGLAVLADLVGLVVVLVRAVLVVVLVQVVLVVVLVRVGLVVVLDLVDLAGYLVRLGYPVRFVLIDRFVLAGLVDRDDCQSVRVVLVGYYFDFVVQVGYCYFRFDLLDRSTNLVDLAVDLVANFDLAVDLVAVAGCFGCSAGSVDFVDQVVQVGCCCYLVGLADLVDLVGLVVQGHMIFLHYSCIAL